ncbi:MAG: TIGR02757 family protein [Ignavibacteria bacterium]
MSDKELKKYLDSLYSKYHKKFSSNDPVWILHEFYDKKDIEIIGFITSCYSYGRVDSINAFIRKLLNITGNKVHEFTSNYNEHKDKKYFEDMYYRFNSTEDLSQLISKIRNVINEYSSLEDLFLKYYSKSDENILPALKGFTKELNENKGNEHSLKYLVPLAESGSACKRLNLYLRWMVRNDDIDLGIWENVAVSKLLIPVDTHVYKVSKILGLAERNTSDMKFVIELTKKLKTFNSEDPVRYDFAICHAAMEGILKH